MAEQELDRPQIAGSAADQNCLRAAQVMRPELGWNEPDAVHYLVDKQRCRQCFDLWQCQCFNSVECYFGFA